MRRQSIGGASPRPKGNADAQFKLAVVHRTGQGVAQDEVFALANATMRQQG